jgi:hypothetical protein
MFLSYKRSLLRSWSLQLRFDLRTNASEIFGRSFSGKFFQGNLFQRKISRGSFPGEAFPGETFPEEIVKCSYRILAHALKIVVQVATQVLHEVRRR